MFDRPQRDRHRSVGQGLALAVAVAGLDIATKALVEANLHHPVNVIAGARFALGYNSGIAFGTFSSLPTPIIVVGLVAVVGGVGVLAVRSGVRVSWVAAGSLGGGAVGNLIDRIGDGRVTDYIQLPHWPPFNVADISITAGIALLLIGSRVNGPVPNKRGSRPLTGRT